MNNEPSTKKALKYKKRKLSTSSNDSSSDAFISDTEYTFDSPNAVCSCCYEWGEYLYKCSRCHRKYHEDCHIPIIIPSNEEEKEWQCTLCKDITAISKDLGKYDLDDISDKTVRRKIIDRILMELLCRFKDIDHFRDSSPRTIYMNNLKKNTKPTDINTIISSLRKNEYLSLNTIVEDIKHVFINTMSCYDVNDPYHKSANKLLEFFNRMYDKWIMHTFE
ncbi:transcription intermediary factor 1-alpha-like [Aphis gossypii]|uniref:PHD-type domain-containing protein n=1 Tax=Aphis gossypii TaxID=80765 RepID=A0A9P0NNA1_APHGO|nr:transcription intermediary factor 1-alpha-like [Aphis gossypii]XP_027837747.1 transcription intermediary factor 1-alpha-like [Aphis gossypii]XP_027837771.1 transcription intermediary factor 1-alpha-like [Aphis gossypii]XP_050055370.1 transcription intermediary factor 1-alpha-like [Aphis gossypii]XP_050055371.1 transcription intermediary factor 1-alpha-like [Aphis gossypii]XP_050055372.1 transcription intermediary factor 1-alpha-like [Aphis gossypii]CAH1726793.1 unnamed protein product [Aph